MLVGRRLSGVEASSTSFLEQLETLLHQPLRWTTWHCFSDARKDIHLVIGISSDNEAIIINWFLCTTGSCHPTVIEVK
jgi:hypothetical protein